MPKLDQNYCPTYIRFCHDHRTKFVLILQNMFHFTRSVSCCEPLSDQSGYYVECKK